MVDEAREWGWTDGDLVPLPAAERDDRLRVEGATGAAWSPHCARVQPADLARGLASVVRAPASTSTRTPVVRINPRRGGAASATPYGTAPPATCCAPPRASPPGCPATAATGSR